MHLITASRQRLGDVQLGQPAIIAIFAVLITAFLALTVGLFCIMRQALKNRRTDDEKSADAAYPAYTTKDDTPSNPSQISNVI